MALNPTMIWLLAGVVLCVTEFIIPTAFVALIMGMSAFAVAAVSPILPFRLQVLLWMGVSLLLVLVSRRFLRSPRRAVTLDATEAETLTEIPPGKTGRALYEGNSWAALCDDPTLAIAPGQKVYVVRRQGTTLIVMPEHLLHS